MCTIAADGGVINITAAVCTAGFHWWRSGNKKRTQNVSEYMLLLALCLVLIFTLKTLLSCAAFSECICSAASSARRRWSERRHVVARTSTLFSGLSSPSFRYRFLKKTTQHLRRVCRKRNFKNKQAESKQIRSLAYGIIKFLRGMTNRLSDLLRLLFIYVTGGF